LLSPPLSPALSVACSDNTSKKSFSKNPKSSLASAN